MSGENTHWNEENTEKKPRVFDLTRAKNLTPQIRYSQLRRNVENNEEKSVKFTFGRHAAENAAPPVVHDVQHLFHRTFFKS